MIEAGNSGRTDEVMGRMDDGGNEDCEHWTEYRDSTPPHGQASSASANNDRRADGEYAHTETRPIGFKPPKNRGALRLSMCTVIINKSGYSTVRVNGPRV